jgi:hypothetical protein
MTVSSDAMIFYAKVSIARQELSVWQREEKYWQCPVSTAKNGVGFLKDSGKTPLGMHYVRAAIGKDLSPLAVLKGRRPTGEIWSPALAQTYPERDWILGRILWLCGLESGVNRGGQQDTFHRYIYLHGSPEDQVTGIAASHGCIRLKPKDMCFLYEHLGYGSRVEIHEL